MRAAPTGARESEAAGRECCPGRLRGVNESVVVCDREKQVVSLRREMNRKALGSLVRSGLASLADRQGNVTLLACDD